MLAAPSEEQRSLYRLAFVKDCLVLVVRAYKTLNAQSLQSAEETHITGELVRAARMLTESEDAEPWMEHIEVLDDPPQHRPGRYGKRRPRIDIEFVRTERGRRPRFHIEAKRLYRSDSVNEYFGHGGLQMFIHGEYAGEWPSAGMVGYVQVGSTAAWLDQLAAGFAACRTEIRICEGVADWVPVGWEDAALEAVTQTV